MTSRPNWLVRAFAVVAVAAIVTPSVRAALWIHPKTSVRASQTASTH
jgi:hypothetical protein